MARRVVRKQKSLIMMFHLGMLTCFNGNRDIVKLFLDKKENGVEKKVS